MRPPHRFVVPVALSTLAIPLLLVTGAAGASGVAAAPTVAAPLAAGREIRISFEDVSAPAGDGQQVENGGSGVADATVRTHAGATADPVRGRRGGTALRLPPAEADADAESARLAVVTVSDDDGTALDPGTAPFAFGASFRLDKTSNNGVDNGDNLMQRGTYGDKPQVKIQMDDRRPLCRVKGSEGEQVARANRTVRTERWFELKCRRTDAGIKMTLTRWKKDGTAIRERWWSYGPTGSLSGLADSVPLSIGGKTTPKGELVPGDSDQFNGLVDDVFFDIQG